jgi:hypothetical protein
VGQRKIERGRGSYNVAVLSRTHKIIHKGIIIQVTGMKRHRDHRVVVKSGILSDFWVQEVETSTFGRFSTEKAINIVKGRRRVSD